MDPNPIATRIRMAADPHRPRYHFLPPANWMNDPNGLIQMGDRYHLFYQHNPRDAIGENIHWGHAVSEDLVRWTDWPIALAPTPGGPDASGCWSGCTVHNDGVPTIIYTGRKGDEESVCLATSRDGLRTWQKHASNPVIPSPPEGLRTTGFRDPYVWHEGKRWMMAMGSGIVGQSGAVLLYRSPDLGNWQYLGPLLLGSAPEHGTIWECPSFFPLGQSHVLIVSVVETQQVIYFLGDYRDGQFLCRQSGLVDDGASFYAPHVRLDEQGRALMFGWLKEGRGVEVQRAAGWSGVQSLPRLFSLSSDGQLRMEPAPEVASLRGEPLSLDEPSQRSGPDSAVHVPTGCAEIQTEFEIEQDRCGLRMDWEPGANESVEIVYSRSSQALTINAHEVRLDLPPEEPFHLQAFVDRSVVEVFVNRQRCWTGRFYPAFPNAFDLRPFGKLRGESGLKVWPMQSTWPDGIGAVRPDDGQTAG